MKSSLERIMLVVWKWKDFKEKTITADLLAKAKYQDCLSNIEAFNDDLYDRYIVCEQLPSGKNEPIEPKAYVLRVSINKDTNIDQEDLPGIKFLLSLINSQKKEDNVIYVYLHRRDGFTDKSVSLILEKSAAQKCFLIGEGRDIIYGNRKTGIGLLNDKGGFFTTEPEKTLPAIEVADDNNKLVFQPHFDKVWYYYQHEFYTKVIELKEDLLSYYYQFYPDFLTWEEGQYGRLQSREEEESKALWLRIISFIDDSYKALAPEEELRLKAIEEEKKKSYIFDDFQAHLLHRLSINGEYNSISNFLYDLFFSKPQTGDSDQAFDEIMRTISQRFDALLHCIKQSQNH